MGKRGKKYILLVLFLLVLPILISALVNAGCCLYQGDNFCQDVSEQVCCNGICPSGFYENVNCNSLDSKCQEVGCCLETCESNIKYSECGIAFSAWKNCDDTSIEECQKGCCVQVKSNGTFYDCDDNYGQGRYKKDCVKGPSAFDTDFYAGVTGSGCNKICSEQTTPKGSIHGVVIAGGSQVVNAFVLLGLNLEPSYYTYTSSTGYRFDNIPVGEYIITAYYYGYKPVTHKITIYEDQETVRDFNLNIPATKGYVTGKVRDKSTGIPIENSYVSYYGGGAFTDKQGEYLIENVDSGQIDFTATAVGYKDKTISVNIDPGALQIIQTFELLPLGYGVCNYNNIVEGLEECDDGNKNDLDGCSSNCKIETCENTGNYCFVFGYQCLLNNKIVVLANTCGYDSNKYPEAGCCKVPVEEIPICINGHDTNQPISVTNFTGKTKKICKCGNDYYDSSTEKGYCCNNIYSTSICSQEKGWLTGLVKDTAGVYLNNVLVEVIKDNIAIGTTTTSTEFILPQPQKGFYEIYNLPAGIYDVRASLYGYYPKKIPNVQINANEPRTLHITLEKIPEECLEKLPPPNLNLKNIKGTTNIKITWSQNCIDEFDVTGFSLYRNNVLIKTFSVNDNYEYTDADNLNWGTEYEYKLVTLGNKQSQTTKTINTGNMLCKGVSDQEFCLNHNLKKEAPLKLRATCDDANQIYGIENCGEENSNRICRELDYKTWCTSPDDCKNLGVEYNLGFAPNILGMYYYHTYNYDSAKISCLYNITSGMQRYCYYDSYLNQGPYTTIDRCLDCKQDGNCFDYRSEGACIQDNCNYGNCNWYSKYAYSDFGKGFCYQQGYTGIDYCYLCSASNNIFENVFCEPSLCRKLGACVSIDGSCSSCGDNTRCEGYTDQFSCVGSSNGFNIQGQCNSSENFEYSEDVCDLGLCKWLNNKCVKDGNDDNIADCKENDMSCQIDVLSPFTMIKKEKGYIDSNGTEIEFSTDGQYTYYCIGAGTCCPDKIVLNNKVLLPNDDFSLSNTQGNYNLYFFSVDNYKNTEPIKKEIIYVDTKAPKITVTNTVTSNTSDDLSDLIINVAVDEKSYCKDTLKQGYDIFIGSKINQEISTAISAAYTRLHDGFYLYSVECKDSYGNIATSETWIVIDRVKRITILSPINAALLKNPVNIGLSTTTKNYCRYKDESGNWNFIGDNRGQGILDPATGEFKYEKKLPNLNSGSYNYLVECYIKPELGTENLYDATNLVFTVDELGPATTAKYEKATGIFVPLENILYKNPKIKLECTDNPKNSFGCKETKYCYDASNVSKCTPKTILPENSTFTINSATDVYLCYNSVDKGNNVEETKCNEVRIDTKPPELSIDINTKYGTEDLPKITYGEYRVTINSNEPLVNITKFEFKVNNKVYSNLLFEEGGSQGSTVWSYRILIPTRQDFSNLEGKNAEFIIQTKDLYGNLADSNNIVYGRYFEIDTKGPNPVNLVPDLSNPYLTRAKYIKITGFTNPPQGNIQVIMNLSNKVTNAISGPSSSVIDSANIYDPNNLIDTGKNRIKVWDIKTTTFTVGKYLQFNHKRTDGKRYRITNSYYDTSSALTVIDLTPSLGQDITNNEVVQVFNEEIITGWFSFDSELNYGENLMEIISIDEIGNIGNKITRTIIFDSKPFEILSYLPPDGTVTSNTKTNVSVVIKDEFSEIDTDSINLTINNQSYNYNSLIHYIKDGNLFLTYTPKTDLIDGKYVVSLSGEDILGNYNSVTWEFEINRQVPSDPQFRIKNGNYYPLYDLWYTNNKTPTIELIFFSDVTLTETKLVTTPSIKVNCNQVTTYKFECIFSSQLNESKHKLEFRAKKFTQGDEGVWIKEFIVDATPPILKFTNLHPVNKPQVDIQGTYEDLNMDKDSIITVKGDIVEAKRANITSNNIFFTSIVLNNVIEKDYTIIAEAYDKASNYGYKTDEITLDLTAGSITITDLKSTDGSGKIVEISPHEYRTNIDKKYGLTIFGITQENLILDIYQNGNLLTDISPLNTNNNEFSFKLTLVNGINDIVIKGKDISDNPTEEENIIIELDKKGPIITITID